MADDVKGAGFVTPKILRERLLGPISKGEREALENHIRKKLLLPQIKGFMSHYYKKPYQNFMWKIERNYFG